MRNKLHGPETNISVSLAQTSIWRDWNRRWRMQSVPLRDYQKDELETCCENAGLPPTPQPDIMYGYMAHCFSQTMQDWLDHHGDIIVLSNGPILPYWVVEWKSTATGGNMFQAKTQARRDGAAAVYAM